MSQSDKNDFIGGSVSGLLAVPASIAYATIIFAPFGNNYLSLGLLSCVIALFVVNVTAAFFGSSKLLISSVYSLTAVMYASLAQDILNCQTSQGRLSTPEAFKIFFLAVGISGLLQCLISLIRLGHITKFVPYPVISGLRNGAALTIILSQIHPLLGIPPSQSLIQLSPEKIAWPLLFIGLLTFFVIQKTHQMSKVIPSSIIGILVGTALYYLFLYGGIIHGSPQVIGAIPRAVPTPYLIDDFAHLAVHKSTLNILWSMLPTIFSIAVVNTMQTLITCVTADNLSYSRSSSNRELFGQGIGNILSSFFGGIALSGLISMTLANHQNGGRSKKSRWFSGATALAVLILLGPLIAILPKIVLTAVLFSLAFILMDTQYLLRLKRCFSSEGLHPKEKQDFLVIFSVTITMLFWGPIQGVFVGAAISIFHFLLNQTIETNHSEFRADKLCSNIQRNQKEFSLLCEHGHKILLIRLTGPLFFGNIDRVTTYIESKFDKNIEFLILDFAYVSEIDSTAAKLLLQCFNISKSKKIHLMFSSLYTNKRVGEFVMSQQIGETLNKDLFFSTHINALAKAEDLILDRLLGAKRYEKTLALNELPSLYNMSATNIERIQEFVSIQEYMSGQAIFRQGEQPEALFFLASGRLKIFIENEEGIPHYFGMVCSGSLIGEMGILDNTTRSATLIAEDKVVCYLLKMEDLFSLFEKEPQTGIELFLSISQNLTNRIRILNRHSSTFEAL